MINKNKRNNDAEYIHQSSRLIELTLEAFGIFVKVNEVNILEKFYEYYLEVAVGTNLEELEKRDRDLAISLASPTGKVYWQIPVPGKTYIGLRVPKPSQEYIDSLIIEKITSKNKATLLGKIAFIFFMIGRANYWIARKILGEELIPNKHKSEKLI